MGAAAYIGRVGALAVALGVGTAIATGHGVAFADDTPSDTSNSTNSNTSSATGADTGTNSGTDSTGPESATTTPGASTTQSTQSTEPAQTGQSGTTSTTTQTDTAQTTRTQTSSTTSTTVADGVVVSAQTNTGSTGSTAAKPTQSAEPEEPEPEPEPEAEQPEEADHADETDETDETVETVEPEVTPELSAPPAPSKATSNSKGENSTVAPGPGATTTVNARTVASLTDPGTNIGATDNVAVFTDARVLAAAGPTNVSPMMAAQTAQITNRQSVAPAATPNPLTAVANLVSSVVNWVLSPLAGAVPTTPAQPPFIWSLLAFARREFENFFGALTGRAAQNLAVPTQTTSLALDSTEMAALVAAAAAGTVAPPYLPFPNAQVSPSTQFVSWVTGDYLYGDPTLANTLSRYTIYGTDLGIMWDNGIPDDPSTPDINEHQVLIALGDTFGGPNCGDMAIPNTLFRSSDTDLSNGIDHSRTGSGTPATVRRRTAVPDGFPTTRDRSSCPSGLPAGVTLIPTAGISLPTPGTERLRRDPVHELHVGHPVGRARPVDHELLGASPTRRTTARTCTVAPQTVRHNEPWSGNQNFQQSAFVRPRRRLRLLVRHAERTAGRGVPRARRREGHPRRHQVRVLQRRHRRRWFGMGPRRPGGTGTTRRRPRRSSAAPGRMRRDQARQPVSEMSVQYNKYTEEVRRALRRPVQQHRHAHVRHARRAVGRRRRC